MNKIEDQAKILCDKYSTLTWEMNPRLRISGLFELLEGDTLIGGYHVRVDVPDSFPKEVPIAFEIGGKIPRELERHVSEDHSLCLFVTEEKFVHLTDRSEVIDFFEGPLTGFLARQRYFEINGRFPDGERSHGFDGVIEFYEQYLELDSKRKVVAALNILKSKAVKGHFPCPCDGVTRLRDCHVVKYRKLREHHSRLFFEERYLFIKAHLKLITIHEARKLKELLKKKCN